MFTTLEAECVKLGAFRSKVIDCERVIFHPDFRKMCEQNSCGKYGKCYTCPPDIGDIEDLIAEAKRYRYALVYQTVSPLEDSFDIEGMMDAEKKHHRLGLDIRHIFSRPDLTDALHLNAGACGVCDVCAKETGEPCRFPALATSSLEAYGIYVSELAKVAEMLYTNGQNTVTYFGAVFFNTNESETSI